LEIPKIFNHLVQFNGVVGLHLKNAQKQQSQKAGEKMSFNARFGNVDIHLQFLEPPERHWKIHVITVFVNLEFINF
jgi:hypothetical protein